MIGVLPPTFAPSSPTSSSPRASHGYLGPKLLPFCHSFTHSPACPLTNLLQLQTFARDVQSPLPTRAALSSSQGSPSSPREEQRAVLAAHKIAEMSPFNSMCNASGQAALPDAVTLQVLLQPCHRLHLLTSMLDHILHLCAPLPACLGNQSHFDLYTAMPAFFALDTC